MNKGYRLILAAIVVLSLVGMSIPAFAGSKCSNPIGDTIDQTPSIKAMQSQPARALSCVYDTLGNKVPTNTDNSGKL
jgi:hypothetical protein